MSDREEIKKMILQEQSEGAIRDCILKYQQVMMEDAMKLRGIYLAYYACGFTASESLLLTIQSIK